MNTKCVRIHGKMDLRLEEITLPEVGPDDVQVKIVSDSVCMSTYKAAVEGEPDSCSVTAIGDWGNPPVRITSATVCHTFGGPSKEEAKKMDDGSYRIAIYFSCCGAQTVWVYEWKNLVD